MLGGVKGHNKGGQIYHFLSLLLSAARSIFLTRRYWQSALDVRQVVFWLL
jgi:hypothetical protein